MKRLIASIIIFGVGCVAQPSTNIQYGHAIPGHPECRLVIPAADEVDPANDPVAGADYDGIAWRRDGRKLGFSRYEDSTIWNKQRCTKF